MKILTAFIFLFFHTLAFAGVDKCEGMKGPKYKDEYNACKELEKKIADEEKNDVCIGLKHENYMSEYNACRKIHKNLVAEEKKDYCISLKNEKDMDKYNLCIKLQKVIDEEEKNDPCIGLKHDKYMTEYNFCKNIQDKQNALGKCEEITETFVICNGNKYVLDTSSNNQLKRDAKKIEMHLNPETKQGASTNISK